MNDCRFTLGSLFDGSGGFPLAGVINGFDPVWASEIEPYPIAVTRSRFPWMKHLGDVSKIHGGEIPQVDVITFGSPCQDMSVAGKRAGMLHKCKGDDSTTRSGLFYEAIRIIREMREATNGRYPTFAVWENVPGAFSSNKGEDFRCVLEEFAKIVGGYVSIPRPANGRWTHAGEIVGDGYSIAWRMLDAQYWGVPQRRKRIYLIADFAGERAGKILFESESLSGNTSPCRETRKEFAMEVGGSPAGSNRMECLNPYDCQSKRIYSINGIMPTLTAMGNGARNNQSVLYSYIASFSGGNGCKANTIGYSEKVSPTIKTVLSGGNAIPDVCYQIYDARGNGNGKCVPTITGDHNNRITDYTALVACRLMKFGEYIVDGTTATITTADYRSLRDLVVEYHDSHEANCSNVMFAGNKDHSLLDTNCKQSPTSIGRSIHNQMQRRYCLRRLTPLECCRLQGFPDGWGIIDYKETLNDDDMTFWQNVRDTCADISGKPRKKYSRKTLTQWYNGLHSDSAEYKMWGNGIALPCAAFVLGGIHLALRCERQQ